MGRGVTPTPYVLVLLALAAFRTWKLIGHDDLTEPLRKKLSGKTLELVECPWCLGSWVALAWSLAWALAPDATTYAAVPLAVAALVGLIGQTVFALSPD